MGLARRWLQLHLSTAVVLMLVAGVLCGLNVRHRSYCDWLNTEKVYVQGWPYDARLVTPTRDDFEFELFRLRRDFSEPLMQLGEEDGSVTPPPPTAWDTFKTRLSGAWAWTYPYHGVAADTGIAIGILLSVAMVCEWRLRNKRRTT